MEDEIKKAENKMGVMPVGKLLFKMSLPAIFSMLIQALYNIVDSIFVSQITPGSEVELSALTFAFPLQMIIMAIPIGIGVGANSVVARRLGQKNQTAANNAVQNAFFMLAISYLLMLILSFFLPKAFLNLYDATGEVKELSITYLTIVMSCSFGLYFEVCANKLLQATGNMRIPMISQLIGALTNIILDPIFIFEPHKGIGLPFGLGLGVAGAAYATVIAQIVAAIFVLIIICVKKHEISFSIKKFKVRIKAIKDILKVAISVTVINSIGAFTTMVLYAILSVQGVTVLGTYFKIQSFIYMPIFGLTQGAMPIIGYNFGAKNRDRFLLALKYSIYTSLVIMAIGVLIFQLIPRLLLGMFDLNESLELGIYALRIISICFIPSALSIVISTMFQAIGHGGKSLLMGLLRQAVLLIPIAILLKYLTGQDRYVWFSYPISEIICCSCFIPIAIIVVKKIFQPIVLNE